MIYSGHIVMGFLSFLEFVGYFAGIVVVEEEC